MATASSPMPEFAATAVAVAVRRADPGTASAVADIVTAGLLFSDSRGWLLWVGCRGSSTATITILEEDSDSGGIVLVLPSTVASPRPAIDVGDVEIRFGAKLCRKSGFKLLSS